MIESCGKRIVALVEGEKDKVTAIDLAEFDDSTGSKLEFDRFENQSSNPMNDSGEK